MKYQDHCWCYFNCVSLGVSSPERVCLLQITSEEAMQQAQAEDLTLLVAENKTGYFGVHLDKRQPKPYQARVSRGGSLVSLGSFATAEEAALCIARSPEGRAAAAERAAAAAPLTSEEALQQARAERLTLLAAESESKTGYLGVYYHADFFKPYEAQVRRGGKKVSLGIFATAEEAALCVARSPEGQAIAAKRAATAAPLTSEEARQQAQVEGLTLLVAESKTGYFGVRLKDNSQPGLVKPYEARVRRGGKDVYLGYFATAEEAALCVARSPEGAVAAVRAAAVAPAAAEGQGVLPAVLSGAHFMEEDRVPPKPPGAFVKEEGVVPPMPPDAFVKVEVVVKREEGSDVRPKRHRER
eukprot:scaffold63991_cov59-Phaeocystis_antarctica.AAC.2